MRERRRRPEPNSIDLLFVKIGLAFVAMVAVLAALMLLLPKPPAPDDIHIDAPAPRTHSGLMHCHSCPGEDDEDENPLHGQA